MWRAIGAGLVISAVTGAPAFGLGGADERGCLDARLAPADAVAACSRIIAAGNLSDSGLAQAYRARAAVHVRTGDDASAQMDIEAALRLTPKEAGLWRDLGLLHMRAGAHAKAVEAFDAALLETPDDAKTHFARALAHAATKAHEAALADYDTVIRLTPDDAEALFNRGLIRMELRRWPAAREDFSAFLRRRPDDPRGYRLRARTYIATEHWRSAKLDLDDVLARDPRDAGAYFERGRVRARQRAFFDAAADLDAAARLDPKFVTPARVLRGNFGAALRAEGDTAYRKEDYDAAIRSYDEALRLRADDAVALLKQGLAYAANGTDVLAIVNLSAAIDTGRLRGPALAQTQYRRGLMFAQGGRNERALSDFDAAIGTGGLSAADMHALQIARGVILVAAGDHKAALAAFEAAVKADPEDPLGLVNRGWAYFQAGRVPHALDDLDRAIGSGVLSGAALATAHNFRGLARAGAGSYEEALSDHDATLAIDTTDVDAVYARGRANFYLGRFAAAAKDFERAVAAITDDAFPAIWLYLAKARSGQQARRTLASLVDRFARDAWPGPIVALYLGLATAQDLQDAAAKADSAKQPDALVDANFFLAQYLLLRGEDEAAARLLGAVVDTGAARSISTIAARAELKRLRH